MNPAPLKIVYLTSGAGGMFCGSCMNDNSLAKALIALGHDVQLVPLYTPIRTDGQDVSQGRIFFGGINMYLQQKVPFFRWLPRWMDRALDQPWLVRWATSFGSMTQAKDLGALAVSVLRGREGFQRKEVERLVEWLAAGGQPDVIHLSNILTAGCVPLLKERMKAHVVVTLQGDDIFLRDLPEPYQAQALAEVRKLVPHVAAFVVNSKYYAGFMAEYLGIPREKFHIVPLGVEVAEFGGRGQGTGDRGQGTGDRGQGSGVRGQLEPTVGYLARLAPEKGLHVLADAFILLRKTPGMENAKLRIAGWLGSQNRQYAEEAFAKLRAAGLENAFTYVGEVDRKGKLAFLQSIDVLAVPTTYKEPKGIFVLEALASGVPVVMPEHGSFPETLTQLGGGLLHRPEDPQHLAERLHELLMSPDLRQQLALAGRTAVTSSRDIRHAAEGTVEVYRRVLSTEY
ncbi:MAG: glycosyltransferase family 4 protein [Pirellulaceae bacterium]